MKINRVTTTIGDYCAAFDRDEIQVDRTYQRSPEVWPIPARSYLIETILKEFPIPKLAMHQDVDLRSKRAVKWVVDGQQRTMAIKGFYSNEFRLSPTLELEEARGQTYAELPSDLQQIFLSYVLTFDQFEAATEEDVREYFRRINSFTAPLNPEEQRHARYQGPMKWLIVSLAQRYGDRLVNLGVLRKNRAIRMADAKLIAEVVHALIHGVTTTSKTSLDKLYADNDKGDQVKDETKLRGALETGFDAVLLWPATHTTILMRTHVFYSLLLAAVRVRLAWPTLTGVAAAPKGPAPFAANAEENLLRLAAALDEPDEHPQFAEFAEASAEKTNVKAQREIRIRWLVRAMAGDL